MRLLNVDTYQLEDFFYGERPPYAILSHTWGNDADEVSYRDVLNGRLDMILGDKTLTSPIPRKLTGCCNQAREDGFRYVWIDTCCIDKTNSVELQEAINSMFQWYRDAAVCYAYLSDVHDGADPYHDTTDSPFRTSRWFTRGWTLQELLAPLNFRFYDADWHFLGTKGDLCDVVESVTGISSSYLLGITELGEASVAQRMSWAAKRVTKRAEDLAYCLLGLFDVHMPMIYGEKDKAFRRLQEHIIKDNRDDSILAWGFGNPQDYSDHIRRMGFAGNRTAERPDTLVDRVAGDLFASSPADFVHCGNIVRRQHPAVGVSMEVRGGNLQIRAPIQLAPDDEPTIILRCGPYDDTLKLLVLPLLAIPNSHQSTDHEFTRAKSRHPYTIFNASETFRSLKSVVIRIDSWGNSPPGSSSTRQPCWFHVPRTSSVVNIIEVYPQSCWHKDRALIEAPFDLVPAFPKGDGDRRIILTRFRTVEEASRDFVAVIEIEDSGSGPETRCHVMVASKRTSLSDISRKFDCMNDALGRQQACNGVIDLGMELERIPRQNRFVIKLAVEPVGELYHEKGAAATADATRELHRENLKISLRALLDCEKQKIAQEQALNRTYKDRVWDLEQVTGEIQGVKNEIRRLKEKEKKLTLYLDVGNREAHKSASKQTEISRQREMMAAWRAGVESSLDVLPNSGTTPADRDGDYYEAAGQDYQTFHFAIENGFEGLVRELLDRGAEINGTPRDGWTPLHTAASQGDGRILQLLLEKGADVEAVTKSFATPLILAAQNGHELCVQSLLDFGADIEAKDLYQMTALRWAAGRGHFSIVELLLVRGADIEAADSEGLTPLFGAVRIGCERTLRLLLDRQANFEAKANEGWTPLFMAAYAGFVSITQTLLDRGSNKEATDKEGLTPLLGAARHGCENTVRLLLDKGANIEAAAQDGWNALFAAAYNGFESVVQILLERGANKEATDNNGLTPLHIASTHGHEAIIRLLLDKQADIEAKAGHSDCTALHLAVYRSQEIAVRILLERGADVEHKDTKGWTPLHLASSDGSEILIQLLLNKNADIEARDMYGLTPLHLAAFQGREYAVRLLVGRGADIEAKDGIGRTPLQVTNNEEVTRILVSKGADASLGQAVTRSQLASHFEQHGLDISHMQSILPGGSGGGGGGGANNSVANDAGSVARILGGAGSNGASGGRRRGKTHFRFDRAAIRKMTGRKPSLTSPIGNIVAAHPRVAGPGAS